MTVFFDSMLAAHALNEELPIGLKSLASMELGADNWGKGKQKFGVEAFDDPKFKLTPLFGEDGMGRYCARDTAYSHMLYQRQRLEIAAQPEISKLLKHHIIPGLNPLLMMELNGIWVDFARLHPRLAILRERLEERRLALLEYVPEVSKASASFTNDHFLRKWIFQPPPAGLGLEPIAYTDKTKQAKVDDAVLQELAELHPAMALLRDYNHAAKQIEFLQSWVKFAGPDDRLHPHYNPAGTVTGRRSCDNPNLMQTPRDQFVRSILGAPPGWVWFDADYSMIEVRLAAWLANETTMLGLFRDGKDVYRYTAALIFELSEEQFAALPKDQQKQLRQGAKAVVLGFLYGMGPKNFVRYAKKTFGVTFSEEEAVVFRATFFTTYGNLEAWHIYQRKIAKLNLKVESPLGRVRHLTAILSSDFKTRGKAQRAAINSPVQGTGGDCTEAAMNSLYADLQAHPDEVLLVGDIHDALLFQIRADVWQTWAWRILATMEKLPSLIAHFAWSPPIRLKAEGKVGTHWGEGAELTLEDFTAPGMLGSARLTEVEAKLAA